MDFIVLSLGSNVGDRKANLAEAEKCLKERGVKIAKASCWYESEPVGFSDQDDFLNRVLIVETEQSPQELLETALAVERHMGRIRSVKNGPRNIDIDLLFYRDEILSEDDLAVPHPRVGDRRFILEPLCELAGHELHPVLGESIRQLLDKCADTHRVEVLNI